MKQPYHLPLLPPQINLLPLVPLLVEAHEALARFDESVLRLPNPMIVQRAFETQEAVLSSKIEGTQATFDDVLNLDAEENITDETPKKYDYQEIINYRNAITLGQKILEDRPLAENEIKQLHKTLLSSSRGHSRAPGEFRTTQVFIGPAGATIDEALYIPPVAAEIPRLFSNLVNYMHSDTQDDRLIQIAITHYQFEAIHPFLDGNGRTGRLIIPLYLYDKGVIHYPNFYLSEFLEKHRSEYYDALNLISETGNWQKWITFFLRAIREQARLSKHRVELTEKLHKELCDQSTEFNSIYAYKFIDGLFMCPRFTAKKMMSISGISNSQTMYGLIEKFLEHNIIIDITPNWQRNKKYSFEKLLNIVENS